jgi:diguanylate cyclase (GGDEF)-like protein
VKRRRAFFYGFATSAALVLGLLVLRTEFASGYSLAAEFLSNRLTYIYVFVTTAVVFMILGYILGRQADELRRLSTIDALTGLYNRRAFHARLREEWRRSRRYRAPLSLLLIDVDGLKQVNDDHGHDAGDRVLRGVAGAIKHTLRETDFGARWGGDEFAIVAPNTARTAAHRLGQRLLLYMKKRAQAEAAEAAPTVSVGLAILDSAQQESKSIEWLMRTADQALYQAKASGRNQVKVA